MLTSSLELRGRGSLIDSRRRVYVYDREGQPRSMIEMARKSAYVVRLKELARAQA